ncbi:phospho-N-acetylmuramoyl-pentapeptide-transferase [Hydrogenoanaerobacterium saccharovorans]|uniref:Phospho-N-acetylmuramoyl-pentapeptide-transferase n=1 Tax=Hydrogenoanaerobacterium saccharovorans TaxID=474960 RepID=A0A1H8AH08_9FIRM|nr:phospho-N-acetylmuramoyl-pentapeptide-transferase [Hydrogenoanaerobacterium saccharovorans]RPF48005.1 phospho-N-acetylmuramoyl-pentapeptide-transferase [Hydrogenoanaerobacterium saccharovorans]SEM68807.1 Phospho-N-acetylmuramoyl-pentapeptide-transferase [Hydrogenoanaerobacterium saccharovorans]
MNTFVIILTAVLAFAITAILGIWFVPFLHKVKYGQPINDIGPTWHKNKQGTPTMGGILFIIGILVAVTVGYIVYNFQSENILVHTYEMNVIRLFSGLVMALAFGFMGFIDDYIKVVRKRNLGLTALQKIILQTLISGAYLATLYVKGDTSTIIVLPFFGQLNLGVLYYPVMMLFIIFMVNAVNLTDGIDGLAASVTFVVSACFMLIAGMLAFNEMNILATAVAGAMIGYLVWNFHPAKVFMGDTGSMFLGGLVVAMGYGVGLPAFLIPIGIVYICEAGSVVLQVASFKLTGKRIFKMSPIHHHFEMSGFSEVRIVALFSLVAAVGCILSVLAVQRL